MTNNTAAPHGAKDSLQNKAPLRVRQTLTLRGDRGQCAACREYFNSTYAFDKHRVGRYTPMERRCLNPSEMRAKGMVISSPGFWISKPRSEAAPSSQEAAPSGGHGNALSTSPVMRISRDIEGAANHA
jgi:hypothetical protein